MAYELEVQGVFSAAHAIVIAGQRETLHGHDWHVTVTIAGDRLDGDGLLVDFHAVKKDLDEVIAGWHNRNLNETRPFDRVNPTAENVAGFLLEELSRRVRSRFPEHPKKGTRRMSTSRSSRAPVRVAKVRVTEAIGCAAVAIADET
ncbi:MAG: 6-pyruvoyl trahydropterin synthase family protein [Phycisphaerales bacterium]|nr:6-pyruvoyl tetrahydropterin synthase family protein [Phycisphaeraceae bacterium]